MQDTVVVVVASVVVLAAASAVVVVNTKTQRTSIIINVKVPWSLLSKGLVMC